MRELLRTFRIASRLALFNIRSNLGRSAIICFSLFLGIASVLIMMGILRAMDKENQENLEANGGITTIYVETKPPETNEDKRTFGMSPGLLPEQLDRLASAVPGIRFSIPRSFKETKVSYGMVSQKGIYIAVNDHYQEIYLNKVLVEGRFFTEREYNGAASVCLIGEELRDFLFGKEPWQAKKIFIDGVPFQVIGILMKERGGTFIPITAYWKYFTSSSEPLRKCEFVCNHVEDVPRVKRDIETFLFQQHRGIRDFTVDTAVEWQQEAAQQMAMIKLVIVIIGCIALLLGSIGIVNVFLSILNDQVRALGMQKALGGTDADLFAQQIMEALVLSIAGGGLGILGGSLFARLPILPWPGLLLFSDYVMAMGVSCGVGAAAALLPAFIAARLSPAEAMRANG